MLGKRHILNIQRYEPGKPIEEVTRELGLKDVIKLASNENPLGPSPMALDVLKSSLSSVNRYPDAGCFYLRKGLAKKITVDESNLLIGNGSDEIIPLTLRAFLNKGDEVIVATPTFLIYEIASSVAEANIVKIPMKDFRYNLRVMRDAVTSRTRIVFIANPDNPTGTYVTKDEVHHFLQGLPDYVIAYFDEAYYEFAKDERDYPDTLKYLKRQNVIITRTFSKAYGLAGLRVGYAIANPSLIRYLDKVREPFNVNSLGQYAALAALSDNTFLRRTKKMVKEGKDYLYRELKRIGLSYIPSATNFILIDVKTDGRTLFERMLSLGVIVRALNAWKLNNFIRVTIGTYEENEKFIRALRKALRR